MTCMAMGYELLLESASEVNDLEYLLGLSSLGALSEARVITGSCLGCSYSFNRVNVRVEARTERALAFIRVVAPKVPPLAAMMVLFFLLVMGTA
ncbi:hypothetical protein ACFX1S_000159 [Malus domestica]